MSSLAWNINGTFNAPHQVEVVWVYVGLAIVLCIIPLETYSLYLHRSTLSIKDIGTRTNTWNLGISLSFFIVTIFLMLMWTGTFTSPQDDDRCNAYSMMVCQFYFVGKQFSYLLFFERLLVVHKAMNMNTFRMRIARGFLVFAAVAFFPLGLYWVAYVYFSGVIVSDVPGGPGFCEQDTFALVTPVYFAVLDTPLSLLLLVLFLMPLLKHIKQMNKLDAGSGNSKKFYGVAMRNFVLSSIMICSSLTLAMLMTIVEVTSWHGNERFFPYLSSWRTLYGETDLLITLICCHLLTLQWLPKRAHFFNSGTTTSSVHQKSAHPPHGEERLASFRAPPDYSLTSHHSHSLAVRPPP